MNIIRLNWRTLIKIIAFLALVQLVRFILNIFFQLDKPFLEYDYSKREFQIRIDQYNFDSQEAKDELKRLHNDFYLIDQTDVKSFRNENFPKEFQIKSARFAYSKIPLENWAQYLENIVKLGLNTVEIEVVWNLHESNPKDFEFKQKNLDLEEFIKLVKLYNLYLLVRIDPYLPCSNYDMGGLPNWLLADRSLDKRENIGGLMSWKDSEFLDALENFLNTLMPILASYQAINGGPIIGLLIQHYNQALVSSNINLRFYDDHYLSLVKRLAYYHGFIEIFLKSINLCEHNKANGMKGYINYCDPNLNIYLPIDETRSLKYVDNFHYCILNDESVYWNLNNKNDSKNLDKKMHYKTIRFKSNLQELITSRKSFSLNNFYCLPNSGFSNGANDNRLNLLSECLVDETGYLTKKYFLTYKTLRSTLSNKKIFLQHSYYSNHLLKLKDLNKKSLIDIPVTHILPFENLIKNLHSPIDLKDTKNELYFEYININYSRKILEFGYILYRLNNVNLKIGTIILVKTEFIRDYAILICDSVDHLLTVDHSKQIPKTIFFKLKKDCLNFQVIVENMGRTSVLTNGNNFSSQRKGFLAKDAIVFKRPDKEKAEIGGNNWKINIFDFSPKFYNRYAFNSDYIRFEDLKFSLNTPLMAYTKFNIIKQNKNQSVYFLLSEWTRGVVILNGYNLGRYSNTSSLSTLSLPNSFLINGTNEIVILDLQGLSIKKQPVIYLTKSHVLN